MGEDSTQCFEVATEAKIKGTQFKECCKESNLEFICEGEGNGYED